MVLFKNFSVFLVVLSLVVGISKCLHSSVPVVPGLSYTYYQHSCPNLENIIGDHLWEVFNRDITQAAALLRLHFHDCFVKGCDGSVLLDGSPSSQGEKDAPPNLTLRLEAFKIINDLRAHVHYHCGRVVSCADILTIAARESVYQAGGPFYYVPLGRKDALSFASRNETLANLPPPFFNTTQLINAFAAKSLNTTDLVALSGGHTIGLGHCNSFTNRLYPTQDPTMDQTFANNLKLTCPTNTTNRTTNLDIRTPNEFDNKYYVNLMNRQGLFTSDQDLYTDSRTRGIVTSFATNQTLFYEKFRDAMVKMGQISVLTGTQGEIRANCSATNARINIDLESMVKEDQEQEQLSKY